MDQTTQQNAALVEQTAAASQAMGEQAGELQRLMAFFRLEKRETSVASIGAFSEAKTPVGKSKASSNQPARPQKIRESERFLSPSSRNEPTVKARPTIRFEKKSAATASVGEWEEF